MEDTDEEEDEDEMTKMIMRGRKEKKMKEKMTNGTQINSNLPFLIFSSPWGQVAVCFFLSPCAQFPCFRDLFCLYGLPWWLRQ